MIRAAPLAILVLALAAGASAQSRPRSGAAVRVAGYADDDDTLVLRPHVSARGNVDEWSLGGSYSADVISSASIDVVTRASRPIEEARHQLDLDAAWYGERGASVGGGYTFAIEPDFDTHGLSLRGGVDLDDERMWHGSAALLAATNRVTAVNDPRFEERTYMLSLALALARILGPSTLARVGLEAGLVEGFQASAYRAVRLGDWQATQYTGPDPSVPAWQFSGVTGVAREHHPDLRLRARLAVELAQDLGSNVALLGRAAAYGDDWGLAAGDFGAEVRWEPERALLFRLGLRAYVQGPAWFWRRRYASIDEAGGFLTDDKELGPLRSYTLTLAASIPVDDVRFDLRVDGTRYEYPGFSLLPEKHALSLQLGVAWTP